MTWKREVGRCPSKTGGSRRKREGWQVCGLVGLKETKLFLPHPLFKLSIVGSLRDREVAYSVSDLQGSNFKSCVWRTVSSHSSHHPQEVLLAQFSLYVHKSGLKPDSFNWLRYIDPMWVHYWASVADGGPILNQHLVNVPCCLRYMQCLFTLIKTIAHKYPHRLFYLSWHFAIWQIALARLIANHHQYIMSWQTRHLFQCSKSLTQHLNKTNIVGAFII